MNESIKKEEIKQSIKVIIQDFSNKRMIGLGSEEIDYLQESIYNLVILLLSKNTNFISNDDSFNRERDTQSGGTIYEPKS